MVVFSFLFASFIVILSIYYTGDKYNIFLLSNLINFTTTFFIPLLASILNGEVLISLQAILLNIFSFLILFLTYLIGRGKSKSLLKDFTFVDKKKYTRFLLLFSLLVNVAFILYSVQQYGITGALVNSRSEIYTQNRQGTGQIFYVAATFLNLYTIIGLFVYKRKYLHLIICILFALPYGNKTRLLIIFFQFLVYFLYMYKDKFNLRKSRYLILAMVILPTMVFALFWFTSLGLSNLEIVQQAIGFANEYQTFFSLLISNFDSYFPQGHLHGKILFEDSFYPFIPRVLWQDKPEYFGTLYIAHKVFPIATEANQGAPSFGPYGQAYVDFGFIGALIQIAVQQSVLGYALGKAEKKLLQDPSIKKFLVLICAGFGGILGIGGASNPVVMFVFNLIFVAMIMYPYKFRLSK